MQQRRLRLGDILDDYCPRERRITNHAVVAMIDEQVKQTRCTTCDAEHEYKEARTPAPRRKKGGLEGGTLVARLATADREAEFDEQSDPPAIDSAEPTEEPIVAEATTVDEQGQPTDDDGPVHRRLIRATLPRPEGQPPDWKEPEFTIRQPGRGGRDFDGNRNGHRGPGGQGQRQGRHRRQAQAGGNYGNSGSGNSRFGGSRQDNSRSGGGQGHGQGQRHQGNRTGGTHRGPGRKRGR